MAQFSSYTIDIIPPEKDSELFGAWCEELKLSAFGETEHEAFYNLIENIPLYFAVKNESKRMQYLRTPREALSSRRFSIPAFV